MPISTRWTAFYADCIRDSFNHFFGRVNSHSTDLIRHTFDQVLAPSAGFYHAAFRASLDNTPFQAYDST